MSLITGSPSGHRGIAGPPWTTASTRRTSWPSARRSQIAGAALYVVPLRIGGGSRLKILEALAMQKPVLSTSVGAEGLTVTHGENVLLADGSERFAAAIVSCLDDPDLRDRIGRAGRRLVEERYGWEKLGEKLQGYLIEVAGTQTDAQP